MFSIHDLHDLAIFSLELPNFRFDNVILRLSEVIFMAWLIHF